MKTIDVSGKFPSLPELLEKAREEDVLVRDAEGREYVLFAVDDFDQEIIRTRKNEKLMAFLENRAKQPATIPLSEVKRKLGL